MLTRCKQLGIYNNPFNSEIQKKYAQLEIDQLFEQVLNKENQNDVSSYNRDLYCLHYLVFNKVPAAEGFNIYEALSIIDFSVLLANLEVLDYCRILNYLKKIKLININDVQKMLKLFYLNVKQYEVSDS